MVVRARRRQPADGGELVAGGDRREVADHPDAYYVEPALVRMPGQTAAGAPRDVRSDPLRPHVSRPSTTRSPSTTTSPRASPRASSPATSVRPSASSPPTAPTAGSSTSTSAPPAPRSAGRSAARSPPAAVASPAPTPGGRTCVGRRTASTTRISCRWRKGSGSADPRLATARVTNLVAVAVRRRRRRVRQRAFRPHPATIASTSPAASAV